jgi:hypothetical protein
MKKIWLAVLVVAILSIGLFFGVASGQEDEDSLLSINMTGVGPSLLTIGMDGVGDSRLTINQVIVIQEPTGAHVYPISCSFGLTRPGDIRATESAFTILNAGNTTMNVTIAVSGDWYGSTNWTHSDDCIPGVDVAGLIAIVEDGNGHSAVIVKKTEPYNNLVADLEPDDTCTFALEFYAPTEFTDYTQKSNRIFIEVSEAE